MCMYALVPFVLLACSFFVCSFAFIFTLSSFYTLFILVTVLNQILIEFVNFHIISTVQIAFILHTSARTHTQTQTNLKFHFILF